MDADRFDAVARTLGAGSRRRVLATLAGLGLRVLIPWRAVDEATAKKRGGKGKRRRGRSRATVPHQIAPITPLVPAGGACYPGTTCLAGRGTIAAGCDFAGTADLRGQDVRGAILSRANLTGVDASNSDFRGALLDGACLVRTNLRGSLLDSSTILEGAIFCHTLMPDGSVSNRDCERGTACCPTPPLAFVGGSLPCDPCPDGSICDDGWCQTCDVCATGCSFTTVQAAIDAARPFGTIFVCRGAYTRTAGAPVADIDKPLRVLGTGGTSTHSPTILAGGSQPSLQPVVRVRAGHTVQLRNLTISGGHNEGNPGGGVANAGHLSLVGVVVEDNRALTGGGIDNAAEATLHLDGSVVQNNTGHAAGGGIANESTVRIGLESQVRRNQAMHGGGLFNSARALVLLAAGSRVTANTATVQGGGVYNDGGHVAGDVTAVAGNIPDNCFQCHP